MHRRVAPCHRRPSPCCRSRLAFVHRPCRTPLPGRPAKRGKGATNRTSNPPKINEVGKRLHTKSMKRLTAGLRFTVLCLGPFMAHAEDAFEVHAQSTYVRQGKPEFTAAYSGPKSFT